MQRHYYVDNAFSHLPHSSGLSPSVPVLTGLSPPPPPVPVLTGLSPPPPPPLSLYSQDCSPLCPCTHRTVPPSVPVLTGLFPLCPCSYRTVPPSVPVLTGLSPPPLSLYSQDCPPLPCWLHAALIWHSQDCPNQNSEWLQLHCHQENSCHEF